MTHRMLGVLVGVLGSVALVACTPAEPLTAEEAALCGLIEDLDVFAEDVTDMSPSEFEAAQLSQTQTFMDALELAPAELADTISWIVGQFEAINAVYEDIGWDLRRVDEVDRELLAVVAVDYPEAEAEVRYGELDAWVDRRC